jgi:hypothetical protein
MSTPPICRHCFRAPPCNQLGLCSGCNASAPILRLYLRRRKGWSPAWETRIEQLSLRACLRLPLFPMESFDEPPAPGGGPSLSRRRAMYLTRRFRLHLRARPYNPCCQ